MMGTVSAVDIENLDEDEIVTSEPEIEVDLNGSDGGELELEIGDAESYTAEVDGDDEQHTFDEVDLGSGDYGRHNVTADLEDGGDDTVKNVYFDGGDPVLEESSPEGFTDEDEPVIEAEFEDDESGLSEASIEFDGTEESETIEYDTGDEGESTLELEIDDVDELDDGEHTVEYTAEDRAGNTIDDTWDFTVDTTDVDPDEFEVDPDGGLQKVEFGDDFEVEVEYTADNDHASDVEAYCIINGNEEDTHDLGAVDEGDSEDFECEFDEEYFDTTVDFEVELEDGTGDLWVSDLYIYDLDASAPTVDYFRPEGNVSAVNEGFEAEYNVFGGVGEVDTVEYFVGDNPGLGDGTGFIESEGSLTVEASELEEGENEVSLRGKDSFDRWGATETFTVEYLPDAVPEASLSVTQGDLEITSDETETVEIVFENTGDLLIDSGEIEASELNVSESYADIEPGEQTSIFMDIESSDLGEHNPVFEASTVDASANISLLVRANESQQDEIQSEFDDVQADFEALEDHVDDLRPSLSDERRDRLDDDYNPVENTVSNIESALDEGRYYEASNLLEGLPEDVQDARNTFATVEEEHETAVRNRYLILGGFVVSLFLAGAFTFVMYSDEYELDTDIEIGLFEEDEDEEDYSDEDYGAESEEKKHALERIKDRVKDLRSGEEDEEPEYEFK